MTTCTVDSIPLHDLAAMLLKGDLTHERVILALKVAAIRGYTTALNDETARMKARLEIPVEFPIRGAA